MFKTLIKQDQLGQIYFKGINYEDHSVNKEFKTTKKKQNPPSSINVNLVWFIAKIYFNLAKNVLWLLKMLANQSALVLNRGLSSKFW